MATTLPPTIPTTHPAVITPSPRHPLAIISQPTIPPSEDEVLIHVLYTASTPLELHQADGGLGITSYPLLLGSTFGGVVVALGPSSFSSSSSPPSSSSSKHRHLALGDQVFGFAHRGPKEAAFQTYLTTSWYMVSKLPANMTLQQAVTVPCNLITAFHTLTADLGLELPWPRPEGWVPKQGENETILVWGAASSVGMYSLQVLRYWGYRNVLAVASGKHHAELKALGAKECFDYHEGDVVDKVVKYVGEEKKNARLRFILDCIGSKEGTLRLLSRIAGRGTKVAILLPVILTHASKEHAPVYEGDVEKALPPGEWEDGVELHGAKTFFFLENEFFKDYLQTEIIPTLLEQGVVLPNKQKMVEGVTLLERAQKALDLLRDGAVSGEKLVWRVADEADGLKPEIVRG